MIYIKGVHMENKRSNKYIILTHTELSTAGRLWQTGFVQVQPLDRDSAIHLKWTGLAALCSFGHLGPTDCRKSTLWSTREVNFFHSRTHSNATVTACASPLTTTRYGVPQTNHHREMKPFFHPKPNADMRSQLSGGRKAYKQDQLVISQSIIFKTYLYRMPACW